jgi:hypothetical protein
MIGNLVILDKKVKEKGGKLVLCNLTPLIKEVLAITRLDQVFEIRNSVDEAFATLQDDPKDSNTNEREISANGLRRFRTDGMSIVRAEVSCIRSHPADERLSQRGDDIESAGRTTWSLSDPGSNRLRKAYTGVAVFHPSKWLYH